MPANCIIIIGSLCQALDAPLIAALLDSTSLTLVVKVVFFGVILSSEGAFKGPGPEEPKPDQPGFWAR